METLTEYLSLYRPETQEGDWVLEDSFRRLCFRGVRTGLLVCDGMNETLLTTQTQLRRFVAPESGLNQAGLLSGELLTSLGRFRFGLCIHEERYTRERMVKLVMHTVTGTGVAYAGRPYDALQITAYSQHAANAGLPLAAMRHGEKGVYPSPGLHRQMQEVRTQAWAALTTPSAQHRLWDDLYAQELADAQAQLMQAQQQCEYWETQLKRWEKP